MRIRSAYCFFLPMSFLCMCVIYLLSASIGWAQDTEEFQESKDDFIKALDFKGVGTKGWPPKSITTKGPAEIDYDDLIKNPLARSKIQFDFDSDTVKEASYTILRNLAAVLQEDFPDAVIVIVGHTDSTGTEEYNLDLSKRRAQAVKHVLVSTFAITPKRLELRWFGENKPITGNDTKAGQARNRRVEFIRYN